MKKLIFTAILIFAVFLSSSGLAFPPYVPPSDTDYDATSWDGVTGVPASTHSFGRGPSLAAENSWTADQTIADDKAWIFGTDLDIHVEWDNTNGYWQWGDGTNDFFRLADAGTTGTFTILGSLDIISTLATGNVPSVVLQGYTQTTHSAASTTDVTGSTLTVPDGYFTEGHALMYKAGGTVSGANGTISVIL